MNDVGMNVVGFEVVGFTDGPFVGLSVGSFVGILVGSLVGFDVGQFITEISRGILPSEYHCMQSNTEGIVVKASDVEALQIASINDELLVIIYCEWM